MTQVNVHDNHLGLFNARSGKVIDLNNPTKEMIELSDIATALSRICRFGGHTKSFYSVAEHSFLVAALAPEEIQLEALFHDASEAYLGDVIKPLKNLLGAIYKKHESLFENAIADKFNLEYQKLLQVKQYDLMALDLEFKAFMQNDFNALKTISDKTKGLTGNFNPYQLSDVFTTVAIKLKTQRRNWDV